MGYFRVFVVCLVYLSGHTGLGAPVKIPEVDQEKAYKYMVEFGYMEPTEGNQTGENADPGLWTKAVKQFQIMAGINQTGYVDEETGYYMSLPRCGNKDQDQTPGSVRRKRWAVNSRGGSWKKKIITYSFQSYPTSGMTKNQVEIEIARAFRIWSSKADIEFKQTTGVGDIEIMFAKRAHGDDRPFDGPNRTLAHAFYPVYGGDAHFDDDETFTYNNTLGINLLYAAAHEFGHSLGLDHSIVTESLMAPFYKGYIPGLQLHQDDTLGIQFLYGAKPTTEPTTTTAAATPRTMPAAAKPPTASPGIAPEKDKHTCDIDKLDAVINFPLLERTYIFSGSYFWRLDRFRAEDGYPKKISEHWFNLPDNIDAALDFADTSGTVYFFKGKQYWKYSKANPTMTGYPKRIGIDGFKGIPSDVDAAFLWSGNSRVYFTKGRFYYRLENHYNGNPDDVEYFDISPYYPRALSRWQGLPSDHIDAAVRLSNRVTYFFKDKDYYRFDDHFFKVKDGYPKSTLLYWIGCNDVEKMEEQI